MTKTNLAVHNSTLLDVKRRWPLKRDYLDVPRGDAVALINEYGVLFGLDSLRACSNFRHWASVRPENFDPQDLHKALEIVIGTVNASGADEKNIGLSRRLMNYFEPLNGRMAVRLRGYGFVISPKAATA
jgi:hypothetical protein